MSDDIFVLIAQLYTAAAFAWAAVVTYELEFGSAKDEGSNGDYFWTALFVACSTSAIVWVLMLILEWCVYG